MCFGWDPLKRLVKHPKMVIFKTVLERRVIDQMKALDSLARNNYVRLQRT